MATATGEKAEGEAVWAPSATADMAQVMMVMVMMMMVMDMVVVVVGVGVVCWIARPHRHQGGFWATAALTAEFL